MPLYEEGIQCHMNACYHMFTWQGTYFEPHLMVDGIRSGRRIRTAIREYESRVIPNFTTPASGMAGYRTRLTGFQPRVSHEYFIPVRVLFSCAQHAFHATMTVVAPSTCDATLCVIIAFTGFNRLMMDCFQCIHYACMSCPDRDSNPKPSVP